MGRFGRQFGEVYEHIASDIFKFAQAMRFTPTWQQEQLLGVVQRGDPQVAVRSGQGPGKTTASVIVGLWRSIRAENALTVLTAPTMRQCNEVWLAEARRLLTQADPSLQRLIEITRTKVVIAGRPDWGVKTVTATKEENAQGFHERNMTIICEEASGIPRGLIEQFKGTASNPECLFLQIGNPNTRDSAFFDCFSRDRARWTCLHWNAEETPASEWFDPARNRKLEVEFGRDSDVYRIRVLGEFPSQDPNCVLSSELIERAMDRKNLIPAARRRRPDGKPIKQFGMDFARYGGDENTLFRRSGDAVVEWERFAHREPGDIVERAFAMQANAAWTDDETWYVPDAGGIGQGVLKMFYDRSKRVVEFHNGGKAVHSTVYDNRITEAWFNLARKVKDSYCYFPYDPILLNQLANRQYFTTKKGKLILESKDEYMKRGHDSPDRADGLVLTFYDEVEAAAHLAVKGRAEHRVGQSAGRTT